MDLLQICCRDRCRYAAGKARMARIRCITISMIKNCDESGCTECIVFLIHCPEFINPTHTLWLCNVASNRTAIAPSDQVRGAKLINNRPSPNTAIIAPTSGMRCFPAPRCRPRPKLLVYQLTALGTLNSRRRGADRDASGLSGLRRSSGNFRTSNRWRHGCCEAACKPHQCEDLKLRQPRFNTVV